MGKSKSSCFIFLKHSTDVWGPTSQGRHSSSSPRQQRNRRFFQLYDPTELTVQDEIQSCGQVYISSKPFGFGSNSDSLLSALTKKSVCNFLHEIQKRNFAHPKHIREINLLIFKSCQANQRFN